MAQTTLIGDTLLLVGEEVHIVVPQSTEAATIQAGALQVGSSQSVIRVAIIDATNHVVDGAVLNGTDNQEILITKISSALTVSLTCLSGSARVQLLGLSGADAFGGIQTQTADLAPGVLSANTLGRALMATGFFTEAKAADAIAAGALVAALLKDGTFTAATFAAGAGGKFNTNCMDAAACANVFPNGAIPVAKVASAPFSLESVIADPGDGLAIPVTDSGTVAITVGGGAETRTVADPTKAGTVLQIQTTAFGIGSLAVVFASDVTLIGGQNSVAFTAVGQTFLVVSIAIGAGFKWRVLSNPQALVIS